MSTCYRLFFCSLLFCAIGIASCSFFTGVPSVPRLNQGGVSVLVDGPDQPAASRVVADLGAFAQGRGFVRPSGQQTTDRYALGDISLQVSYLPSEHRVTAYLHSAGPSHDRTVVSKFYIDFHQQYAGRYGDQDVVSELTFAEETGGVPTQGGASGPGSRGQGSPGGR